MRRALLLLAAAALAVALAWWVAGLPGRFEATVGVYTLETSTPVAVVALAVLLLVLDLLLRIVFWLLTIGGTWRRLRGRRARRRGDEAVGHALVAIAAGEASEARRSARRALGYLGPTPQTLLLAATAARLDEDEAAATAAYRDMAEREDAAFLGLRGLYRQAIVRQDYAAAAELARRAAAAQPGSPWLRAERTRLAERLGHWEDALTLAPPDAPRATYAVAAAAANPTDARRLLRQALRDDPGFAPLAIAYARLMRTEGRESRAADALRTAWQATPVPELADLLLEPLHDPMARLREGSRLVRANPEHPESRMLMARLSLAAGLTGEARRLLDAARHDGLDQRRLWLLQAELDTAEQGEAAPREALRRAAMADPDPAWRCEACGTTQPHWRPTCPACHATGRIAWGTPSPAVAQIVPTADTLRIAEDG